MEAAARTDLNVPDTTPVVPMGEPTQFFDMTADDSDEDMEDVSDCTGPSDDDDPPVPPASPAVAAPAFAAALKRDDVPAEVDLDSDESDLLSPPRTPVSEAPADGSGDVDDSHVALSVDSLRVPHRLLLLGDMVSDHRRPGYRHALLSLQGAS